MPRMQKSELKPWSIRNFPYNLRNKLKIVASQKDLKIYEAVIQAVKEYVDRESK